MIETDMINSGILTLFVLSHVAFAEVEWHEKVNITLYYESLCPDCCKFITEQLVPTYHEMRRYFNARVIPYGNAKDIFNKTTHKYITECQHGEEECTGNKIAACSISLLRNETKIINFVGCMSSSMKPEAVVEKCALNNDLKYAPLKTCYTGQKGESLQQHYGKITRMLTPKFTSVPAISINNVYDPEEQDLIISDLHTALCNHMKEPKPNMCKNEVWTI